MAKAMKLKAALDRQKGVNYKLEKQKKLQKEAEKRKRHKAIANDDDDDDDDVDVDVGVDVDALEKALAAAQKVDNGKSAPIFVKEKATKAGAEDAEPEWETDGGDESGDEDVEEGAEVDDEDEDEGEVEDEDVDDGGIEVGRLSDESDSESEIDDDAQEDGEEDEEDIPLSDIESLASEEKADVIPHQRLTINNTAALQRSLKSFALPSSLPFSANQTIVSAEPTVIQDVEDDINRELGFYKQSLEAVTEARAKLKQEGVPFSRPTDYFAEMVKSEEQMGKVRSKMLDEAARKKASADARRQRDLKKFGKAVQVAKLQERQKEKRETLDRISTLKRKRQGADLTTNEGDMFDVALEDAAVTEKKDRAERRAKSDGPNRKRQKKNEKFGFGGKKRFSKSNDAKSTSDDTGYSIKKMKGGKPGKQRPGKSKRAKY